LFRKEHVVEKTAAAEDLIGQLWIIQEKADGLATERRKLKQQLEGGNGEVPRAASENTGREK